MLNVIILPGMETRYTLVMDVSTLAGRNSNQFCPMASLPIRLCQPNSRRICTFAAGHDLDQNCLGCFPPFRRCLHSITGKQVTGRTYVMTHCKGSPVLGHRGTIKTSGISCTA